jgi:hypoxanthine-guanine phosphoribosyltransferase
MKRLLDYQELTVLANQVSEQLKIRHAEAFKNRRVFLFAIARGGMTFGHLVSQRLNLPLGILYPATARLGISRMHPDCQVSSMPTENAVFVYLEDVIAEGRTFSQIMDWHKRIHGDYVTAEFVPVVVDHKVDLSIREQVNIFGMVTGDWIVFPYEDPARMVECDRGLFRDGTSQASKD